mmetsp:Transcript_72947/g.170923  ORF Transcript_72947/g.170923 Transcript_72947/m.170923 type:complete len:704 (-) Transcript_72947:227-2338(-)
MGNCVERTSGDTIHVDEHLLFKDNERFQGGMWCSTPKDNGTNGPFHFRVRFQPGKHLDNEAKVVEALMELLWVNPHAQKEISGHSLRLPVSSQSAAMKCVAALKSLKAAQADTVLDFVVPIINVILHAPCMEARNVLWECFVLDAVRHDVAFGHLFFWALRAVESSPQAKIAVQTDAQRRMHSVQGTICSKAQLKITLRHLEEANAAVRRGDRLPEVPKADPNRVSPLVDVCERLHYIGTQIVQEKDRQQRLFLLQNLLDQEINKYLKDDTPVPAQMLAPHAGPRKPLPGSVASLLRVNRDEARVLSSKARAPYMVMLEVEEKPFTSDRPRPGLLRRLCGSRKMPVQATHHFAAVPPKHWPPEDSSPSTSRSREARPKGAFHDETWSEVVQRVRSRSDFGRRPNWSMIPMIVKSNADDVRQEELAYRLIKWFERVFRKHNPKLWLQPFLIIATCHDGGVLEVVTNAISISELKKSFDKRWVSLKRYFEDNFTGDDRPHGFGREKSVSFRTATMNFIYSMAAYSVVCYVLAIRDRHNGNIMINDEGHVLHVDFGFMLCGAPGGKAMQHIGGFEHSAGFKLTNELVEVLGPTDGSEFQVFRSAIQDGMKAVRAHAQELLALLQLSMLGSENSQMNCFCHPRGYPEAVLEDICDRLGLPGGVRNGGNRKVSDEEFRRDVDRMIDDSIDHWRSRLYDSYQYHFVGVH